MGKMEIWSLGQEGRLSLSHQLADGRILTWIKSPVLGSLSEYSIRVSQGRTEAAGYPDLSMYVESNGPQILLINVGAIGGRAALGFDGCGAMIRVLARDPGKNIWLDYNLEEGGPEYGLDRKWQYLSTDNNGCEIRTILGNDFLLAINLLGNDAFLVRSPDWETPHWRVLNQALEPGQLAVFSPQDWGRRDRAELMAATIDQIISQRVSPL